MCEHSNVNLAANLREARRRKILQNSENRLKLIEGISSSVEKSSSNPYLEPKPEPEVRKAVNSIEETPDSQLNSKFNGIIEVNEELKEISDFLLRDNTNKGTEEDKTEREEEEDAEIEEIQEKKLWFQVFLHKKLHYILLALIVNILLFFNAGFLFYENIFCPFYTVKIIELLLVAGEKEDSQLIPSLFFVSIPKNIQKFSRVITGLVHLLSDLCVYLYTFIIATKFFDQN